MGSGLPPPSLADPDSIIIFKNLLQLIGWMKNCWAWLSHYKNLNLKSICCFKFFSRESLTGKVVRLLHDKSNTVALVSPACKT